MIASVQGCPTSRLRSTGQSLKEAFISPEIAVTEFQKSWFAEPETSPNDSPTVRVALQEPKTVTQLRLFKLR